MLQIRASLALRNSGRKDLHAQMTPQKFTPISHSKSVMSNCSTEPANETPALFTKR